MEPSQTISPFKVASVFYIHLICIGYLSQGHSINLQGSNIIMNICRCLTKKRQKCRKNFNLKTRMNYISSRNVHKFCVMVRLLIIYHTRVFIYWLTESYKVTANSSQWVHASLKKNFQIVVYQTVILRYQ